MLKFKPLKKCLRLRHQGYAAFCVSSEEEWSSSPGQDLRSTQPLAKVKHQVLQTQYKPSKVQPPSRWTGTRSEGFILLFLFFPKASQVWAQQSISWKCKLSSVTDPWDLTLPVPGAAGCPPAIPTHPTAGKSTHTHKKRVCCSLSLLWLPTDNTPQRPGSTPGMRRCQHSSAWLAVQPGTHGSLALTHSATHLEILSRTRVLPL